MMPIILMVIIFVVLLLMNMPIAFVIGISSLSVFYTIPELELMVAAQRVVTMTQSFTFLAVPFFLLAGCIMNISGITDHLINFAKVLTGHMAGGLAQVSIVLSMLMGGVSGSATADAAMEARFLGPSMIGSGYSKGFTAVVLAFGGLITATFPPSMGLIIYGSSGDVSIGKLFTAGIVPGVLLMIVFLITTGIIAKKRGYKKEREVPPTAKEVLTCLKESIWAIMFPVILIVGIRFGLFTTSEAGAFAVIYAIFIGKFVYKRLSWKELFKVLDTAVVDIGNCMAIICFSNIFSYVFSYCGVPKSLAIAVANIGGSRYMVLIAILVFLIIAGAVMESTVNTLIFTPIFVPIITTLGFDPVHFGIMMMLILVMGCMTPPVGSAMFVTCRVLECSTSEYIKECIPYIVAVLITVVLILVFPQLCMFLPNLLF